MRPSVRRTATLLALPPLLLAGLVATSPAAPAADPVTDPAPVTAGAAWLEDQLTDGVVHNDQFDFDDLGLTIDVGLALDAVGGHDQTVQDISTALAADLDAYITGDAFGDPGSHYAGSTAKALWYAEVAGADVHAYGGVDLEQALEDLVATDAPITGRIQDVTTFGDSANTIGQIFAAEALTSLGSDRAADVRAFLLQQQCADGFFRLNFAKSLVKVDQSCDGGSATASPPDTDVTAAFVIAMQPFAADDEDVSAAVDGAIAWLADQQRANGAFGGGPTTEAPNTNSTGLAGWALATIGDLGAAADAAAWVRAHQAANVGDCTGFRPTDLGAIAYDPAARNALVDHRITTSTRDQFRRATAQALPVLAWAPPVGETAVLAAPGYVKAGSETQVGVVGAAPGEALCATVLRNGTTSVAWADSDGEGHLRFVVPKGTTTSQVRVSHAAGVIGTAEVSGLAGTDLRVGVASRRIAPGRTQVVTVRGLEPGEAGWIEITWPRRGSGGDVADATTGQANGRGVLQLEAQVPRRPGTATVRAGGEFRNRAGATTFVVTR